MFSSAQRMGVIKPNRLQDMWAQLLSHGWGCWCPQKSHAAIRRGPMLAWAGASLLSLPSVPTPGCFPHHSMQRPPQCSSVSFFAYYFQRKSAVLCVKIKHTMWVTHLFLYLGDREGSLLKQVLLPGSLTHCHLVGTCGTATVSCGSAAFHGAAGTDVSPAAGTYVSQENPPTCPS